MLTLASEIKISNFRLFYYFCCVFLQVSFFFILSSVIEIVWFVSLWTDWKNYFKHKREIFETKKYWAFY